MCSLKTSLKTHTHTHTHTQNTKLSKIKYPCQDGFTGRISPTIYKIIQMFYNFYQKMEE